jgi:PAT family beta-lactamase induction signal transducer AmpG
MVAYGVVSGLPLALSGFTLRQWLTEGHVSLAAIGLTANIGLSYTLKFLWAPLLDEVRPPLGLARFGQRRGWLLLLQPFLVASVAWLALSDAAAVPGVAIAAAACIAFFSATQDIAIDAWRIEAFEARLQGAALAGYVWGYRLAMLVSGAGVIAAAGVVGWHGALGGVTGLAALGVVVTLLAEEAPAGVRVGAGGPLARGWRAVRAPLGEFLRRPGAFVVLAYVALFNLGEAMAGVMLAPFYGFLGFDRAAVATAVGPFSLVATMSGIGVGGWVVARLGLPRALILTGFVQMGAMALYVLLSGLPGNHGVLYGTVVTEAFVQGLASAAFLAYLSMLCRREFAATQYALLSSVAPIASHTVGGFSGFLVQATGWTVFYAIAMAAALPAMVVMLYILRRHPPEEASS